MRASVALAAILTGLHAAAFAPLARADDAPDEPPVHDESPRERLGPQAGLRVAYTDGLGVIYQGLNLSDASAGALPIVLDVGWRVRPELYVGVYGQYAPVFLKTYPQTCPSGWSCTAEDWRVGIEVDYHFLPRVLLDPYVGVGAGYEILHTRLQGNTIVQASNGSLVPAHIDETLVDRGWEFASLTIGFDWRFSEIVGAGLFLLGTIGEYDVQTGTITATSTTMQQSASVVPIQMGAHELAAIGVRGTFNL
jgi:hypothetical protein